MGTLRATSAGMVPEAVVVGSGGFRLIVVVGASVGEGADEEAESGELVAVAVAMGDPADDEVRKVVGVTVAL